MTGDYEFEFYKLFHGGVHPTFRLPIGRLPGAVVTVAGWRCDRVYLSPQDVQKIRFYNNHKMAYEKARTYLPRIVSDGDIFLDEERNDGPHIIIVLHDGEFKKGHQMVCAIDAEHTGIFMRTVYYRSNLSRRKLMVRCKPLLIRSRIAASAA